MKVWVYIMCEALGFSRPVGIVSFWFRKPTLKSRWAGMTSGLPFEVAINYDGSWDCRFTLVTLHDGNWGCRYWPFLTMGFGIAVLPWQLFY